MDEGEEVAGSLVVACGDAAELLDLGPEAFGQVAVLVTLLVDQPLLLATLQRRDHHLASHRPTRFRGVNRQMSLQIGWPSPMTSSPLLSQLAGKMSPSNPSTLMRFSTGLAS